MGVAKAWRFSLISANLALLQPQNSGNGYVVSSKNVLSRSSSSQRKATFSWSMLCGVMLFALGLISLFTGHIASDLEWYSQHLVNRRLYSKLVILVCLSLCVKCVCCEKFCGFYFKHTRWMSGVVGQEFIEVHH